MSGRDRCRVAVVGAGPAGCAAAAAMARRGIDDVVVLERGQPGKDKPCGDAFLPDAVQILASLGVDSSAFAGSGQCFSTISLWNEHESIWTIPLGSASGWIAPRARVDQALRDAVAQRVTILYGAAVRRVETSRAVTWRLDVTIDGATRVVVADAIILASGAVGGFGQHWQIDGRARPSASVSAYVDTADVYAPLFQFIPGELQGYGWAFPLGGRSANVGYCATVAAPGLRVATERYLKRWSTGGSVDLRGGVGPLWSGLGTTWHHDDGLVSCGDAAGLVDPLTGEGITAALESGLMAGAAVSDYVSSNRGSGALRDYTHRVSSTYGQRYRLTSVRRTWASLCQVR